MKLSELIPNSNIKVLCIGDSGAGKTVFATSFPGKKHVADFDGKIVSAANFYRRHEAARIADIDYEDHFETQGAADSYARFYSTLVRFETEAKAGKLSINTYVLDSLTTFFDAFLREVMRQNPSIKGPAPGIPSIQHYGIATPKFKEQLGRILALPCHVVVTAHIDVSKDEVSGEIIRSAKLPGKLSSYLPIVFGEVYRAYAEQGKDSKIVYMAQTKSDSKFTCRSQISGLPDRVPLSYESLVKAY